MTWLLDLLQCPAAREAAPGTRYFCQRFRWHPGRHCDYQGRRF